VEGAQHFFKNQMLKKFQKPYFMQICLDEIRHTTSRFAHSNSFIRKNMQKMVILLVARKNYAKLLFI
jgi:hypothetical protein